MLILLKNFFVQLNSVLTVQICNKFMYAFLKKIFKQKYILTQTYLQKNTNTYKIGKILPE